MWEKRRIPGGATIFKTVSLSLLWADRKREKGRVARSWQADLAKPTQNVTT